MSELCRLWAVLSLCYFSSSINLDEDLEMTGKEMLSLYVVFINCASCRLHDCAFLKVVKLEIVYSEGLVGPHYCPE